MIDKVISNSVGDGAKVFSEVSHGELMLLIFIFFLIFNQFTLNFFNIISDIA